MPATYVRLAAGSGQSVEFLLRRLQRDIDIFIQILEFESLHFASPDVFVSHHTHDRETEIADADASANRLLESEQAALGLGSQYAHLGKLFVVPVRDEPTLFHFNR